MDEITSFGEWLRRRRKALDLTQAELADRAGCVAGTIRSIEAEARRPSKQLAERLAMVLQLAADERAAFLHAARAELAADRLPSPAIATCASPAVAAAQPTLPSGTVTFLMTDIEGSTQLWEQHPQAMRAALAHHDTMLHETIAAAGGVVVKGTGDGLLAAFTYAADALTAAVTAQRSLQAENWSLPRPLLVRMALHTGVAEERTGDYYGPVLNRLARILAAGHGGQILVARATVEIVADNLSSDLALRDLGAHQLKDLSRQEHIYQLIASDLPATFPALRTLLAHPNNLSTQPTTLIGREQDLAALGDLVCRDNVRLVTLTGPGGIGKTRLAVHTAAELLIAFADGVWFVDLAHLNDPSLVILTIMQTLGLRELGAQPPLRQLHADLHDKQLLLVLDNFEQVIAASVHIAELLAMTSQLKILVTSRVLLHLRGETEYAVSPLALPDPNLLASLAAVSQYAAVKLFIQRAQNVKPDFQVTNENAPAVAEICRRLDGLPLAIELTAARIKLFAPEALLKRLDRSLALLTSGPGDLPVRQRTLRATIDWSYHLLSETEQRLFAGLGIFMGGFTLEAVAAVCCADSGVSMEIIDSVTALVDKSLLRQPEGSDTEPRFSMLETIREYASERLNQTGEAEALRQRHAQFFLALAEAAAPKLRGHDQGTWLVRLRAEYDNLRAALAWTQEAVSDVEIGLRLAGALWWFWELTGRRNEGLAWIEALLELPEAARPTAARAKALYVAAYMAWHDDLALFEESLVLARQIGDKEISALALREVGNVTYAQGDEARGVALLEESLALLRELGNLWGMAEALRDLATVASDRGNFAQATALLEESLVLSKKLGDKRGSTEGLCDMGRVMLAQEQYARAAALFEESLVFARELADQESNARALLGLGDVALAQGDYAHAATLFEESLARYRSLENRGEIANALGGLGDVALAQGDTSRAKAFYGEAVILLRELGDQVALAGMLMHLERAAQQQNDNEPAATC